jgi:hypothetical protein
MEAPETAETSGYLLAQARKAGFSVKDEKLRRWQRRGLLPPVQRHGLGRGRGTESLYPAGSAKQLVALCAQVKKRRVLRDAAWAIWWENYPVSEAWIRERLEQYLILPEELRAVWNSEESEKSADPVELIERWAQTKKRLPQPLGRIRRSLRQNRFITFLIFLLQVVAGIRPLFSSDEEDGDSEVTNKGFAIKDAQEAETDLEAISKALDPTKLRSALDSASFEEICEARDEVREPLSLVHETFGKIADALGIASDRFPVNALDPSNPTSAANVILVWLPLRGNRQARRVYEIVVPLLREIAKGTLEMAEALKRFDQLAAEDPPND